MTNEKLARRRAWLERKAKAFRPGDVVVDSHTGDVGILTEVGRLSTRVAWWHGGARYGPAWGIRHRRPRRNIPVPSGARGHRWWNRQQAVTAALRRAGIEVKR